MHSSEIDAGTAAGPDTSGVPVSAPERRRWAPFWFAIGILALVLMIPVALGVWAPDRDPEAIGFVEQVSLIAEVDGNVPAIGGFTAPEGWYWIDADTRESFRSPDGQVLVTARMLATVKEPEQELRAAASTGSALLPVEVATTASGLASYTLTEDLAAGGEVTERTLLCGALPSKSQHCLEFVIVDAQNDTWSDAVHSLINNAEVY